MVGAAVSETHIAGYAPLLERWYRMFDFEARQHERAQIQAQIAAANREAEELATGRAHELAEKITHFAARHDLSKTVAGIEGRTVRMKAKGDPSGAGLSVTVNSDGTYDTFEMGPAAQKGDHLDENAMMDRVLDWLHS